MYLTGALDSRNVQGMTFSGFTPPSLAALLQ